MSTFEYYGRNAQGEAVAGTVERVDQTSVAEYLHQQKIVPIRIAPFRPSLWQRLRKSFNQHFAQPVSDEQLIMFCRQMYTISKAGIPLAQAMVNLAKSLDSGKLKDAVEDIVNRLQSGTSLSLALQRHPSIFNELFVSMIKVGENTGQLETVFIQMSYYLERDRNTRKSIKAALRYPSFVLLFMAAALVVINVFVVPAFANMFGRFNADLPLPTTVLIASSTFFIHYWWLMLLVFIGLSITVYLRLQTSTGKVQWGQAKLHFPIAGALIRKASLARYARSFSVMLKAGVPLVEAIGLCAKVMDNDYLSAKIEKIKTGIARGDSLKRTHKKSAIFTPLILQMIAVGEESGEVDNLLVDVADYYDQEVEYELKNLSAKIEPLLIMTMSFFVLILALGIFLPMWEMFSIQDR